MRAKLLTHHRCRPYPMAEVVDGKPGTILDDQNHPGSILPGLVREGMAVEVGDGERTKIDPRTHLHPDSILGAGLVAMLAHAHNILGVEIPANALDDVPEWLKAPCLRILPDFQRKGATGMDLRDLVLLAAGLAQDAQAANAGPQDGQEGATGAPEGAGDPEGAEGHPEATRPTRTKRGGK